MFLFLKLKFTLNLLISLVFLNFLFFLLSVYLKLMISTQFKRYVQDSPILALFGDSCSNNFDILNVNRVLDYLKC